jgi:hypothetical protein
MLRNIRVAVFIIALVVALVAGTGMGARARAESGWTVGLGAGWPQMVALTAERHGESSARLQLHAGTFVVGVSVGARLVLISQERGVKPYGFMGGGMLNVAEGEGGGGTGWTPFAWTGLGVRAPTGPVTWFLETGAAFGMDEDQGYTSPSPAGAIGVAFGGW